MQSVERIYLVYVLIKTASKIFINCQLKEECADLKSSPLLYVSFTFTVIKPLQKEKSHVAAQPERSLYVTVGHI